MLFGILIFGFLYSVFFITFEIGEIAFFIVLAILTLSVVVKIIKNKKNHKSV